uniref:Predicted protein n=1 Tax=Hordeum vulgare subsp. vulgare TaxID=112509 RepID=F2DJG7_HORVV|nr:predicted protein [Hordeum vulgare subsp. vulgare]
MTVLVMLACLARWANAVGLFNGKHVHVLGRINKSWLAAAMYRCYGSEVLNPSFAPLFLSSSPYDYALICIHMTYFHI